MKLHTAFLLALFSTFAFAIPPPLAPHVVDLPCRYNDVQPLVEYYVSKTASEQTKTKASAGLSRFQQKKNQDGSVGCNARIDISDGTNWDDVGWVHYVVVRKPRFSITVSFLFNDPHPSFTLPDKGHPEVLGTAMLEEMKVAKPTQAAKPGSAHSKLPIVQFEQLPEARQRLLMAGWRPFKFPHGENSNDPNDAAYIRAGYTELDGCAMDVDICILHYINKQGDCLTLYSEGYEPKDAFVNAWNFVCIQT